MMYNKQYELWAHENREEIHGLGENAARRLYEKHCVIRDHQTIADLVDQSVVEVYWAEVALTEADEDEQPLFRHPEFPFIQVWSIRFEFLDGRRGRFSSDLSVQNYGIRFEFDDNPMIWPVLSTLDSDGRPSGFRQVTDLAFPTGNIQGVQSKIDQDGNITEVLLEIGGKSVLLKSGEVYEHHGQTLGVSEQDESILVFLNPDDALNFKFGEIRAAVALAE